MNLSFLTENGKQNAFYSWLHFHTIRLDAGVSQHISTFYFTFRGTSEQEICLFCEAVKFGREGSEMVHYYLKNGHEPSVTKLSECAKQTIVKHWSEGLNAWGEEDFCALKPAKKNKQQNLFKRYSVLKKIL